ncbi:MAG: molybdopterin molybdochelatase [Mycobacterium sp.]|nr:molybdopterin molybdochelatase [Mycobacterium sp.]
MTRPSAPLISVDAHLERVLSLVRPLGGLELTLGDAHGCTLAEDVMALAPLPGFDNSAMDGYAVHAADLAGASPETPVKLPVVADIAAGSHLDVAVRPGMCVRIMTGAPLPPGADAVVPQEWTDRGIAQVAILRPANPGDSIRRAGEDLQEGATVLRAGAFLGAAQVGLLAAAGRLTVLCHPRPRVVVVSTGSELKELGHELAPGQIHDSNSHMLTAAAREAGALAYRVGIVRDDPAQLLETLEDHLIRADLLVTSGGVSVGAYDVVKEVLSQLGTVQFDKVAMQPGMPQGAGVIGSEQVPILTLPGNPVSALVSFEVFARPVIRRMLGTEPLQRPTIPARLTHAVPGRPGRRRYLRARIGRTNNGPQVTLVGGTGSHLLASLAHANALVVVPEAVGDLAAGDTVDVMMLERRGR